MRIRNNFVIVSGFGYPGGYGGGGFGGGYGKFSPFFREKMISQNCKIKKNENLREFLLLQVVMEAAMVVRIFFWKN